MRSHAIPNQESGAPLPNRVFLFALFFIIAEQEKKALTGLSFRENYFKEHFGFPRAEQLFS